MARMVMQRTGKRILVVDDDPSICELLKRELDRRGFDVITADGIDSAFSILSSADVRIDLVLCDIVLPRRDGFSLLDSLNSLMNPVPVILITGAPAKVDEARRQSVNAVLQKPLDMTVLEREVRRTLAL